MQTNTRHARRAFFALAFTLAFGHAASAQSIVDARRLEFTPSSDHTIVGADGVPLVQSYSLDVFVAGSTQSSQTVSLGKPAPASDGMIRLDFVSLLTTPLTPGVVYETRVSAVGPGGSSPSLPSNTFGFMAPCAPAISPASQSFAPAGGSGTVSVTAGAGCAWTAASNALWLTVTAGGAGVANGAVSFAVAASTSTTERSGTLTVAGQTFTVTQAGVGCAFSLSPTSQAFAATGGTGSVAVTTSAGCAWTATSSAAWVTVTASGTGSSTASFTVAANTTTSARSATLTVAGQTFTVTQAAAPCSFSITASSQAFDASGGTGSVAVTTAAGCAWTATSSAAWVTVTASGTGSSTASFTVAANTTTSARSATLTVAGQTFTVTQAAAPCSFSITPSSQAFAAPGGTGSVAVMTSAGCAWGATSSAGWVTVVAAGGTGNGTATFSVAANTTGSVRTATLTVAGQTVTISQSAAECAYSLSVPAQSFTAAGGPGTVAVTTTSGCAWAVTGGASWVTVVNGASGTGGGTVSFTVAANTATTSRMATFLIAGTAFTITQAAPCIFYVNPLSLSPSAAGGAGTLTVTTQAGCAWVASTSTSWITVSGSGTGSGTAAYTIGANTTMASRTGAILAGGKSVPVTQAQPPAATAPSAPTNVRVIGS